MDNSNKWNLICLIALNKYNENNFDFVKWLVDYEILYDHLSIELCEECSDTFRKVNELFINDALWGIDDYILEYPVINESWISSILTIIRNDFEFKSLDGNRLHPKPEENFVLDYKLYNELRNIIQDKTKNKVSL